MAKQTEKSTKKNPALHNTFRKNTAHKKNFTTGKNILHRIFHPDYILFDWEYFSRDLEFE